MPERIRKLLYFIQNKEPLIFLFLLNCEYIKIKVENALAAIGFNKEKKVFIFEYTETLLNMKAEEIYFVCIHECYHAFKRHSKVNFDIIKQNPSLANEAEDAIINNEICKSSWFGFKPEMPDCGIKIPKEYLTKYRSLGDCALSSRKLFYWMLENGYSNNSELNLDIHYDLSKSEDSDENALVDTILKKAEEMDANLINQGVKSASNSGDTFLSKIKGIRKTETNWLQILIQKIAFFTIKNSSKKEDKKTILMYLRNPKSSSGILAKSKLKTKIHKTPIIIFAIDTSGSIFFSENEKEIFFGQIEKIIQDIKRKYNSKALLLQWGDKIYTELSEYKNGDYKNIKIIGGGGTVPSVVFNYLSEKINDGYLTTLNEERIYIGDNLPMLILITDGIFYSNINFHIYENKLDRVVIFTTNNIPRVKENVCVIKYNGE